MICINKNSRAILVIKVGSQLARAEQEHLAKSEFYQAVNILYKFKLMAQAI